jgi:hypothetical protein
MTDVNTSEELIRLANQRSLEQSKLYEQARDAAPNDVIKQFYQLAIEAMAERRLMVASAPSNPVPTEMFPLLKFSAANADALRKEEGEVLAARMHIWFDIPQVLNILQPYSIRGIREKDVQKLVQQTLKQFPPSDYFAAIHITNGVELFKKSCDLKLIPLATQHLYKAWKRRNADLIETWETRHQQGEAEVRPELEILYKEYPAYMMPAALEQLSAEATSPVVRRMYDAVRSVAADLFNTEKYTQYVDVKPGNERKVQERLALLERTLKELSAARKTFTEVVAGHPEAFSAQDREVIRFTLYSYLHGSEAAGLMQQSGDGEVIKEAFDGYLERHHMDQQTGKFSQTTDRDLIERLPFYEFSRSLHLYGMEAEYERALSNGHVPRAFRDFYKRWAEKNQAFIKECAQLNAAPVVSGAPVNLPFTHFPEYMHEGALSARRAAVAGNELATRFHDSVAAFMQIFAYFPEIPAGMTADKLVKYVGKKMDDRMYAVDPSRTKLDKLPEILGARYRDLAPEEKEIARYVNFMRHSASEGLRQYLASSEGDAYKAQLLKCLELVDMSLEDYLDDAKVTSGRQVTSLLMECRAAHLTGMGEYFEYLIKANRLSPELAEFYPGWAEKNQDFIAKCREEAVAEITVTAQVALAEPQVLTEVLEKYNRHIAAMHAEPAYDIKKLHAILALTASFGENIGEPAQREELLSYLSALERKDLEASPHKLLAEYVHDHPRTAEGESFKEVYSVLSTLFIAEAHAAYKAAGLMTAEQFPPHLLFATIESFQFRDAFAAAAERGEIPGDLLEWYGHWKGVGTALDGEHAGTRVLLDDFAYHRDRATHDAEKKIYEAFAILMRNQAGLPLEEAKVAYTPAELKLRQESGNLFVMGLAVTHFDEMSAAAKFRLKNLFGGILTNRHDVVESLAKNPQFQPHLLFQFSHLYGIVDKLEAEMGAGRMPARIKAAYPGWKTSNTSFIARCETRLAGHDAPETSAAPDQSMSPSEQLNYILGQMKALYHTAQTATGPDLNAKILVHEKSLFKLTQVEENYDAFSPEDREMVRAQLRANFHYYPEKLNEERRLIDGKSTPLSKLRNAMTKEGLDKLAGPDLFRTIHIFGLEDEFTGMDKRVRSPKVHLAYLGWKRVNEEFTHKWVSRHVVDRQLSEFAEKIKTARHIEVAAFYSMLCDSLRGKATEEHFVTNFCAHIAAHHDKFDGDDRVFASYQIKSWINPQGKPTEKQRTFWQEVDQEALFRAVAGLGLEEDMEQARQSKFMPDDVAMNYWLYKNPSPEAQPVTVTYDFPTRTEIVDSRLTQINVDHAMVVSGNKTESMGPGQADKDDMLGSESEKGVQFRTETLFTALLKDGASGVKHITVRWDKRAAEAEDDGKAAKKTPLPYNLVDIEMQDGSRSRVVVCDHFGKMTYVCRDTAEWNETDVLQISDLRKDPKVWTAIHISDKQWVSLIQKVLYTPVDALEVDPKTRNSRWGLKGVLTETFVQAVVATGTLPPTSNATVVKEGPLAGRFRWSTLYNAANSGDISELPKGTTWRTLYAELTKEKGEYPALKEFMGRTEKITAGDIHVACTRFQQEFDLAVQAEFYDDIKVRGLSGHAVDLALRFGQVAGWEAYLPEGAPAPQDLEDFVVRSGLAERDGMQLVAA